MTKNDLKELIRECIRERLHEDTNIKEGAFSGGYAGDNSFSGGTVRGMGASTQPSKKSYLNRLKSNNPELVDIMTVKGKDIKPGMITQAGQVKQAEVRERGMYIMHTNNYDGFWGVDDDMEVMVDPDNKSKPFTGDYKDLLKKGLKESVEENASAEEVELEDNLDEGIFGNKYKGKTILAYKGNGKDEPVAICDSRDRNYYLITFAKAHAKKNNNKEADYKHVSATDMAVKRYGKALKSVPDVSAGLPAWVKQYEADAREQAIKDSRAAEIAKEREEEARRREAARKAANSKKSWEDDYTYVAGNGTGTYKYKTREGLEESLTVDNIFENLY